MPNDFIRTLSGQVLHLTDPRPENIDILDIARGLSHCCRFAGQLPRFYSVAQHSVLVADLVEPRLKLRGLLHDASEAYICDLPRFLKHLPALEGYRNIEASLQRCVGERFGIWPWPDEDTAQIKLGDDLAAVWERIVIKEQRPFTIGNFAEVVRGNFVEQRWQDLLPLADRLPVTWATWDPRAAEDMFLDFFYRLCQ